MESPPERQSILIPGCPPFGDHALVPVAGHTRRIGRVRGVWASSVGGATSIGVNVPTTFAGSAVLLARALLKCFRRSFEQPINLSLWERRRSPGARITRNLLSRSHRWRLEAPIPKRRAASPDPSIRSTPPARQFTNAAQKGLRSCSAHRDRRKGFAPLPTMLRAEHGGAAGHGFRPALDGGARSWG